MLRTAHPPEFLTHLQATEHLLSPRSSRGGVKKLNPLETVHSSNTIQAVHEHKTGTCRAAISEEGGRIYKSSHPD